MSRPLPHGDSRYVLASASPRRRAMLQAAGIPHEVCAADIDESACHRSELPPREIALATALAKARAVAPRLPDNAILITADTIVVVDGVIYNKPLDRPDARRMLRLLAGRSHQVITGISVQRIGGERLTEADCATVTFNPLQDRLIEEYLASGEADDKAGAYGIQGLGSRFVADVAGDLTCVIGLPLGLLRGALGRIAGEDPFRGQSLRAVALRSFRDLDRLPRACLAGIPD